MDDFIYLQFDNNDIFINQMPDDESVVEVLLDDSTTAWAYFEMNIMDAGDWDFTPIDENMMLNNGISIADRVIAWRYLLK